MQGGREGCRRSWQRENRVLPLGVTRHSALPTGPARQPHCSPRGPRLSPGLLTLVGPLPEPGQGKLSGRWHSCWEVPESFRASGDPVQGPKSPRQCAAGSPPPISHFEVSAPCRYRSFCLPQPQVLFSSVPSPTVSAAGGIQALPGALAVPPSSGRTFAAVQGLCPLRAEAWPAGPRPHSQLLAVRGTR